MKRSLVVVVIVLSCLSAGCRRSPPVRQAHRTVPLAGPLPRAAVTNRVPPIFRDPLFCTVSADLTITVAVIPVCAFALPAVPVNYTVDCHLVVNTASATGTIYLVMAADHDPAWVQTNFAAWLEPPASSNLGNIMGFVQNVGTGGQGQILSVDTSLPGQGTSSYPIAFLGTWPANGAAQQFQIEMQVTTGVTATVMAGSYCRMQS